MDILDTHNLNDTITVGQLIEHLQRFDRDKKVLISGVGLVANDSWYAPIYDLEDATVDEYKGIVRINFSTCG